MSGFKVRIPGKLIQVKNNVKEFDADWVSISLGKDSFFIYISLGGNSLSRVYWKGHRKGPSAKLLVKFNDNKHMITVNSYKIIFNKENIYNKIKQKATYYKLFEDNTNYIKFDYN
jgi:hypothetical protein